MGERVAIFHKCHNGYVVVYSNKCIQFGVMLNWAGFTFNVTAVLAPSLLPSFERVRKRCGNYETGDMTPPTTRPSVARCPQVDSGRCSRRRWTGLPYLAKDWFKRAKGIGRAQPSFTKKARLPKTLQTKRVLLGVVVQNKPLANVYATVKMPLNAPWSTWTLTANHFHKCSTKMLK